MYFWRWKYLAEAWEADPSLLHAWDRVILDLGGGDAAKGLRGLLMMTRRWATRPLPGWRMGCMRCWRSRASATGEARTAVRQYT